MQRKRGRGRRTGGNNNSNNPNRHYESTGPDVKIRGSAQQILDKYQQYARDALTAGDRVKAEAHFQHAEHYARIVASFQKDKPKSNRDDDDNSSDDDNDSDDNNNESNNNSDNDNNSRNDNDGGEKKPRGRGRKPKADDSQKSDDPMRVIGSDDSDTDGKSGKPRKSEGDAQSSDDNAEDPKPRRRTYRKKAEASNETEGVMSTLARGRSGSDETRDSEQDSPKEAAE